MSLHSTSRTSLFRRGVVALAAAATLLAGGLVAAPAAQAAPIPLVDTDRKDGTVVTTRMAASGSRIWGDMEADELKRVYFRYKVNLDWTGGRMRAFDGVVTLQRIGAANARRFPLTLDAYGDRNASVTLPGTINPGYYRVGIEFTAAVQREDGQVNRHRVNVNNAKTVSIRRDSRVQASITNPTATDGRPSRITGHVRGLRIGDNGELSWRSIGRGTVLLSYDPNGPWESGKNVFVRKLTVEQDGTFTTVVPAHQRWWKVTYTGSDRFVDDYNWVPQGDHSGCGC